MGALPISRPARWYDASPTLAFALQCLMLAPSVMRERVVVQVARIMGLPATQTVVTAINKRREDGPSDAFWDMVNGLKALPESQRQQTVSFILDQLNMA